MASPISPCESAALPSSLRSKRTSISRTSPWTRSASEISTLTQSLMDASSISRPTRTSILIEIKKIKLIWPFRVGLDHDFPADLNLVFHHLDADWLLRSYLPGKITGHSALDGTLQVRGPLRTLRDLKATAEIQSFSAEVEHVQIQSVGPIRFEVADQFLLVEDLHLAGSGTDFTAHGRAHLSGAQELDLRLDGSVNMALWQSLNPKILARGMVGVNLNATGTLSQPVLQGRLEVKNTFEIG